jgi:hydroxymethylglutaryl-CoA synthase
MIGISSYGYYIPRYRITTEEIARQNGKSAADIIGSLGLLSKAVAGRDEDSATMALQAAFLATETTEKHKIGLVLFGSETHPYAVKPTATIIADWLDLGTHTYNAYDTQFACKAGTGALLTAFSVVKAGDAELALVGAADKATGRPGDALEYSAGSGAVAFVVSNKDCMLELLGTSSYSSDTPDFWRRHGMVHPSHSGRFTGKPAFFLHINEASTALLDKITMKPSDFTYAVFHMPNGKFPKEIATKLGFTYEQIEKSLVVKNLGNSYAASALMGLVATLDFAQPGETIFFASYGSGAGSDAMAFKVTEEIKKKRHQFYQSIQKSTEVDYATYLKMLKAL